MAFPTKMYFSLSEVSARWHRQTKDVEYCIENGLLNAHIKVCSVKLTSNMLLNKFPHNSQEIYEYKRLPPVIIPGCKAVWPDIIYTPLEILQQEKCPIRLRPSPEQLSRLDEVLSWTPLLTELERKLIWYKAQRKPWKFICTALGISKSSGNEKLNKALDYLSEKIERL